MTLLVIGSGAESAEDALGSLVIRFNLAVTETFGVDHRAARASCLTGSPDDVVAWHVRETSPSLVLLVEPDDEMCRLDHVIAEAGLPHSSVIMTTDRASALAAMSARLEPTGGSSIEYGATIGPMTKQGQLVTAALEAMPRTTGNGLAIRDRNPRVSVLIPVYNQERFLHATMRSALSETYDDYEVVVVDDGSTDASPAILEQYRGDPRVTVITQSNIGQTARIDLVVNRAIRAARGELTAWMGGDDVTLPHRIAAQVEAFDDDPGLDICHSGAWIINPDGQRMNGQLGLPVPYDEMSMLRTLPLVNLVAAPTAMIRRGAYDKVGMFEEGLTTDVHFWIKSAGRLRFRYLPRRLLEYRMHENGLSTTPEGAARCSWEASRVCMLIMGRRSLADFYPELAGSIDPRAWYEAGLDLGNSWRTVSPLLALIAYDLAAEEMNGPEVHHNRALMHLMLGDNSSAIRSANAAEAIDPMFGNLAEKLRSGAIFQESILTPRAHFDAAMARGRAAVGDSVRRWDGSLISVESAYVAFDKPSALGGAAFAAWAQTTRAGMPLRWVYPDLSAGLDRTLEHLAGAIGQVDLSGAADVVIETVDDLTLLPPDDRRTSGVMSEQAHLDAFTGWMTDRVERGAVTMHPTV